MVQGDFSQLSEPEMSTSGQGDTPSAKHNPSSTSFRKRKRAHKKTKTEDIMIARKLLYWNVFGQPYGRGRAKLASYCGVYVKEVFAPSPDKWDKLSKEKKEMAWHHIQRIFLLEDASKDWVMMTMGTCWRNWKSNLSRKIKAAESMADAEADIFDSLRPEHVSLDQWKIFVDNRRSKAFKEKSEKYQKLSKMNLYRHTIGRMGYAELEDKLSKEQVAKGEGPDVNRTKKWIVARMKKDKKDPTKKPVPVNEATAVVIEKLQNASPGKSIMDDPLAQHLGEEHRGRVRGFGLGATPKGKGVVRNENSTIDLRIENENLKERVSIQETQMEKVMKMVEQLVAERHTCNQQALTMVAEPSVTTSNNAAIQCQTISLHPKKDQDLDELKGKRCKLIHYEGTGEVVADGIISETNPKATCHGEQLGRFFYRVQVDKVYDNSLELPVCALNFAILEDSIGSFIKWPKVFIVPD